MLFEYQQFSFYGSSSAPFNVRPWPGKCLKTSPISFGGPSSFTPNHVSDRYKRKRNGGHGPTQTFGDHVSRLNMNLVESGDQSAASVDCMKISFEKELNAELVPPLVGLPTAFVTRCTAASKFKILDTERKAEVVGVFGRIGSPLGSVQAKRRCDLELRKPNPAVGLKRRPPNYALDDITYGSYVAIVRSYRNEVLTPLTWKRLPGHLGARIR